MNFSTRTIVAVIFAATGAGVLGYLAVHGCREALIALIATVGSVTGFYFGSRSSTEAINSIDTIMKRVEHITKERLP